MWDGQQTGTALIQFEERIQGVKGSRGQGVNRLRQGHSRVIRELLNSLNFSRRHGLRRFHESIWAAQRPLIFFLCLVVIAGCDNRAEFLLSGNTMGTTYNIKIIADRGIDIESLQKKIDQRLEQINDSMSTYRRKSEISRFNRFHEVGANFPITSDFLNVMTTGRKIYEYSDGAWDATIAPLLKLWGFYEKEGDSNVPEAEDIRAILPNIGFHHILIRSGKFLVKVRPRVTLDLGSIAKGYGVDQIADLLKAEGIGSALVEIGGEVFAYGRKPDGSPWTVGINTPRKGSPLDSVYVAIPLTAAALATSGDYRQFFESGGKSYSHILDPRTGYPVNNGVVSVSVLAGSCTLADGLATAIMVMGAENGLQLIERLDGVECLIILHDGENRLRDLHSSGFPKS